MLPRRRWEKMQRAGSTQTRCMKVGWGAGYCWPAGRAAEAVVD